MTSGVGKPRTGDLPEAREPRLADNEAFFTEAEGA
jgi:hypothetical protein